MFYIDSNLILPDIDFFKQVIKSTMRDGINTYKLDDMISKVYEKKIEAREVLKKRYHIDNPNSSIEVLNYIYKHANEEIEKECYDEEKGKWTSNKSALIPLSLKGYEFATYLLQYRKMKKYEDTLESFHNLKKSAIDGLVRPKVSFGKTNRANYSEPALMNIPKELLWSIIAPRNEGNRLVSIDIKNQEPLIMINMLGIEELKNKFTSKEGLYAAIFRDIFGRPCDSIERAEIKIAWNALTYGATLFGIRNMCKHIDGELVYRYFNNFKEYKNYKYKCLALAKKNVNSARTVFGTLLYADEVGSKLKRVLMDIPIQGTGTDILAILIEHFYKEIEWRGLEDYVQFYFSRHDELILECDSEWIDYEGEEQVLSILEDIFQHQVDDWEPFDIRIDFIERGNYLDTIEDEWE